MKPQAHREASAHPEAQRESAPGTRAVEARLARQGIRSTDLASDQGKQEADQALTQKTVRMLEGRDLRGMPPEQAKALLRSLAADLQTKFKWLRADANIQQIIGLMDLTLVGRPITAVLSHLTAREEFKRFSDLEKELQSFFALLRQSGIQVQEPTFRELERASTGKSLLVSLLFPFARGFNRSVTARGADELKRLMSEGLDGAIQQLDRMSSEGKAEAA